MGESKERIDAYVKNAFTAAQLEANQLAEAEKARVRAKMASTGNLLSSGMDHEMIRIESEKINRLLKLRGDALLDEYEIYDFPLDADAITKDVEGIRNVLIAGITSGAKSKDALFALRTGHNNAGAGIRYENFNRQLIIRSQPISHELLCQIEQRKACPKLRRSPARPDTDMHGNERDADTPEVNDLSFVRDGNLKGIIERDYGELQRLRPATTPKAALVLSGAVIEGLLLDALVTAGKWTIEAGCQKNLDDMIGPATNKGIIKNDRLSDAVRKYRTLVHPGREARDRVLFDRSDADLAKSAVEITIREVKDWYSRQEIRGQTGR
ncbi:MAG: hypothetical protein ACRD3Q_12885 [Terriglobales bacterium]